MKYKSKQDIYSEMSRAEMENEFVNQKKKEGVTNKKIRRMLDQMDDEALTAWAKPKQVSRLVETIIPMDYEEDARKSRDEIFDDIYRHS